MRASMNVSLPAEMKAWVDGQVVEGGFGTASEYVRKLLREERLRRLRDEINSNLKAAVNSGEPIPVTADYWKNKRRRIRKRSSRSKQRS